MTLERVRMQINFSEMSFYPDLIGVISTPLASKCHFDPNATSESKQLIKSKRRIRGVKMTSE